MIEFGDAGSLTIRSDDAGIELFDLEYPHADALALYCVTLSGAGLSATAPVEAIGDDGLAAFLSELAQSDPWDGERSWSALSGFGLAVAVNARGNETLMFTIQDPSRDQNWSATARVGLDLGDLAGLANAVREWF